MNTKKMIAAVAVLALAFAAFAFVPTAEDDAADSDVIYLEGDVTAQITSTEEQKIVIEKNVTLKQAAGQPIPYIHSNGELVIKEGATVTIEAGLFQILGDAIIDGNIVSKCNGGFQIYPTTEDNVVNINGSVTAFGNASTNDVTSVIVSTNIAYKNVVVYGDFIIGTNAVAVLNGVYFEKNSTLTVLGAINGKIYEAGLATFDGGCANGLTIMVAEASAVVDIESLEGTIFVKDENMFAYAFGGVQYYVGGVAPYAPTSSTATLSGKALKYDAENETFYDSSNNPLFVVSNQVMISYVENIKITEVVTTAIAYDEEESNNKMYAETKMNIAPLDPSKAVCGDIEAAKASDPSFMPKISAFTGETIYFQTMTIDDVDVTFTSKTVTIEGDITYPLQEGTSIVNASETLEIPGSLAILKKTKDYNLGGTINAAHYTVKDADNNYDHYYTTLKKAISNGATKIEMMSRLVIDENITVPAGTGIEANQGTEVKKGFTLDIADGAKFATTTAEVYGTLIFENVNYKISYTTIYADVELKDGAYAEYTNVYNAFSKAKSGDEINAYKPWGDIITIDEDLTLPAGVTFCNVNEVTDDSYIVMVENGATLTIAGKLLFDTEENLCSEEDGNGWNSKTPAVDSATSTVKDYSVLAIGVNGIIEFENYHSGGVYSEKEVAGAYFTRAVDGDTHYFITNIAYAFENILDADEYTVTVAGENTVENLKVTGTEKERIIVQFLEGSKTTFNGFTFAYGQILFDPKSSGDDETEITGDIGTAAGKMVFKDAIVVDSSVFDEKFIDGAMNLSINGNFQSNSPTETSGTVYLDGFTYATDSVTDPEAYKILTYKEKKFTVPAGSSVFVTGDGAAFTDVEVLIAGDLTVCRGSDLVSDGIVSVTGKLTISKTDGTPGMAEITTLIVGGTTDSFDSFRYEGINGNATVTGAGSIDSDSLGALTLLVFSGASIDMDALKDWMDDAASTEFNVDGTLWMTAYTAEAGMEAFAVTDNGKVVNKTTYYLTPALQNMTFISWQTYDANTKQYKDVEGESGMVEMSEVCVGDSGYEKVYAKIDKSVYKIYVLADEGIDNVSIDGKLMVKGTYHYAEVAAGSHTLSYTLANGYSGNAVITAIDGATLVGSALTFTVNDDNYLDDGAKSLTYFGDESDGKVITLSGIQKSGIDTDPDTHQEESTGMSVTEILLIVVVIIAALIAAVIILRFNRS